MDIGKILAQDSCASIQNKQANKIVVSQRQITFYYCEQTKIVFQHLLSAGRTRVPDPGESAFHVHDCSFVCGKLFEMRMVKAYHLLVA